MTEKKVDWKTNPMIGIGAIALIIIVVFGGSCWRRHHGKTPVLKKVPAIVWDEETNEFFEMAISTDPDLKPPYLSPKTNRKTAYRMLQCQSCMTIYPWKEKNMGDNICPVCGKKVPITLNYIPPKVQNEKNEEKDKKE